MGAGKHTDIPLCRSLSVFFYLTHPQSLSITSLLLPSLFSLVCLTIFSPPPTSTSCLCQCLMALSKAALHPAPSHLFHLHLREIQLDWKPINHSEYRVVIGFGRGRWGEVGGQRGGGGVLILPLLQ